MTNTDVTFVHRGVARFYEGSIRIDLRTILAVIPVSEVRKLEQHWPAAVYDISEIMKTSEAPPVGKAWITRSGRAVLFNINGVRFVSPLVQIRGIISGERKHAHFAQLHEVPTIAATEQQSEVTP